MTVFQSTPSGSMDGHSAQASSSKPGGKDRASTLAPSPNSTPLDSVTSYPDERVWSSGSFFPRASPDNSEGFGSTIKRYFRKRQQTTIMTTGADPQILERLRVTAEKLNDIATENQRLQRLQEAQDHELRIKDEQLAGLMTTNDYCRTLLTRNSELELLIADIQEEHKQKIQQLSAELRQLRQTSDKYQIEELTDERDRLLKDLEFFKSGSEKIRSENEALNMQLKQNQRDLMIQRSTAQGLRGQIETLDTEYEHLKGLHRAQLNAVGDTSKELATIVAENDKLSQMVAELKERNCRDSLAADQKNIDLRTELNNREADLKFLQTRYDEALGTIEELRERLGAHDNEQSAKSLKQTIDNLKADLSSTRLELESEVQRVSTENLVLKEKLKSYEGIHETAQQALAKNSELENAVRHYVSLTKNAGTLRDDLRRSRTSQLEAEAHARSLAQEVKLLETTVARLTEQLSSVQEQLASDATPRRGDGSALETAVKLAVDRCNEDRNAYVKSLTDKYERLIEEIRSSYKSEMKDLQAQYEYELDSKIKAADRQKQVDSLEKEKQVAEMYMSKITQVHEEHAAEMNSYKLELQKELNQLLDRQRTTWQQRMDAKDAEAAKLRSAYEEQLRLLEGEKDKEIRLAAIEMDSVLAEKEKELMGLKAALNAKSVTGTAASTPSPYTEDKLEQLRTSYEKHLRDAEAAYEKLKADSNQRLADMEAEKDSQIAKLRDELDVAVSKSLTRSVDVTKHFQDSIDQIVSEATKGLTSQLTRLQQEFSSVMKERADLQAERTQLERSNIQLQSQLQKNQENNKSLEDRIAELNHASQVNVSVNSSGNEVKSLVQRNRELEETIAAISENYDNDLRRRTEEILSLQHQLRAARREALSRAPTEASTSDDREKRLTQGLQDKAAEIAKLERERISTQRELALRVSEVDALRKRLSVGPTDTSVNKQLLEKISVLQSTLEETIKLDQEAENHAKDAAEARASRIMLQGHINMLEQEAARSEKKVRELEGELKELRANPRAEGAGQQVQETLRRLKMERTSLLDSCRKLEAELTTKEQLVETEIEKRRRQLEALEKTNECYRQELHRNDRLTNEIYRVFDDLKSQIGSHLAPAEGPPADIPKLQSYISSFEEHLILKSRDYDTETQRLANLLQEREAETTRLRQDILTLKSDLERAFARKAESSRLRYEAEREILDKENQELKKAATQMETELKSVREELLVSENFNKQRMDSIIQNLCRQIEAHQLLIAQVQDERDVEIAKIKNSLARSENSQEHLRQEIEVITGILADKDHEISALSKAVNEVIAEAELTLDPNATVQDSYGMTLKGTFDKLMAKVEKSQEEAQHFMSTLQTLLETQEKEIKSVESTRRSMKSYVLSNIGSQDQVNTDLKWEKTQMDAQLANVSQSSQIHQSILGTLKERASIREAELLELSERLNSLAKSTCGSNRPLTTAVETLESQDTKLATLSAEAKQMSDIVHRLTTESWSRHVTTDSISETMYVKRRLTTVEDVVEDIHDDSTPQPDDTKRARII